MNIIIGSDHGGLALKRVLVPQLKGMGVDVTDMGPDCADSCDYPVFAKKVTEAVLASGGHTLGILICGTGQGMAMTANRYPGARAAICTNEYTAHMARAHNDANILCMGERVIGPGLAQAIVKTFLNTDFEGGRHARRVDLIEP